MKRFFKNILRFLLKPVFSILHNNHLPNFSRDFEGRRVFMITELPGGEEEWEGVRRRKARLGNTHPWNRYFNRPLRTKPRTLAEIESFLHGCKYLSDRRTRSQEDYWEPPDVFEGRKTGDCEDHAIWAWRHLDELGCKTRFVLGKSSGWHAWVHIFVNGRAYLLEATQKSKLFPNAASYDAHWSVERIGKKKFAFFLHADQRDSQEVGPPEFAYKWP